MSIKMTTGTGPKGEDVLIFTKKRGRISIREIDEFIMYDLNNQWYSGLYYIPFMVKEDSYQGWEVGEGKALDEDGNEVSDKVILIRVNEGEACHFCGQAMPGAYCPHCGEHIKQEDYKI